MAGGHGYPSEHSVPKRTTQVRLDDDHTLLLSRIADSMCGGQKSTAVELLLDLYGGKILERAAIEREPEYAPFEVTRYSKPQLSSELIGYIGGLVRAGNMPEVACRLAGVSSRQQALWMKRGRSDRTANRPSLHADFVVSVERAEAECEAEDIARLRKHGQTTWTALAWRLERQYPDRYAQRKRIDGKVQHSVFPVVDWDRLSPAETRTLVELLRKASPELDEPGISRRARPALELVPADIVETIEGEVTETVDVTEDEEKPDA